MSELCSHTDPPTAILDTSGVGAAETVAARSAWQWDGGCAEQDARDVMEEEDGRKKSDGDAGIERAGRIDVGPEARRGWRMEIEGRGSVAVR
eukprot:3422843-Rhodomonas_salina.2